MHLRQTKVIQIHSIVTILFLLLGISFGFSADKPLYAVGMVYNDINKNHILDAGEKGIPQIAISNGRDIVQTDKQGKYRIPIEENMILFVIKPTGWITPFDSNHFPLFYYIYKPAGSPKARYSGSAPTGPLPAIRGWAFGTS
ncbi:MAG: metallophosphoesterase N-terminal domain-containing protein [bacterium]